MDEIDEAWISAWCTPDRRAIYAWGREELVLAGDYFTKGAFHVETSRHLILPFELAANDQVRMLNFLKGIQTAGSLVADVFFSWVLRNKPAPSMMTYQTDDDAEQHYTTRIEPTLKASPALAPLLEKVRKKRDLYQFPGMNVYFQGANMSSLQRKSVRYEVNDECWQWDPGMLSEAWGRTEAYAHICKIFNISQGGDEGTDWEMTYNRGRRYEWAVECQSCGHLQPYVFFASMHADNNMKAGVVWDDVRLPDGRRDIPRCAQSARWRCCMCGHDHPNTPRTWERFNETGDYICIDPDRPMKECSLHWGSIVNGRYDDLVAEFLQAIEIKEQGSIVPLKKFYQKKLAQHWSVNLSQEKVVVSVSGYVMETPFIRGYERPDFRDAYVFITADFQEGHGNEGRHYVVVARAWTKTGGSRLLWEGKLKTKEKLAELQMALGVHPATRVCMDGAHAQREVAGWCAQYGWTVLIGDPDELFTHSLKGGAKVKRPYSARFKIDPAAGKAGQGRSYATAFRWSNPSIKQILWDLRHGNGPKWELPADVSSTYKDELDSFTRQRVLDRRTGRPKWEWVDTKKANHAADAELMQTVCAVIAGLLPFDIEPGEHESPPKMPIGMAGSLIAPHEKPEQLTLLNA